MAFTIDTNKLKTSIYHMECKLIYKDKTESVDENHIGEASIVYNYNDNFFPILHMNINITHRQAYEIREYAESLLIRVIITEYKVNTKDLGEKRDEDPTEKNLNSNIIIDEIFQSVNLDKNYFSDYDPDYDANSRLGLTDSTEATNLVQTEELELYLFSMKGMNCNKKYINAILSNASVSQALLYIFNQSEITDAIVSQPDNKSIYGKDNDKTQIILPPLNFKNSIDTLQDSYGIYEIGHIQFLDFDRYYLINKDYTKDMPLDSKEYEMVYIIVYESSETLANAEGCYTTKNSYVISAYDNTSITDQADLLREGTGSKYNIMSKKSVENCVTYDEDTDKFTFMKPYNTYKANDAYANDNSKAKVVTLYADNNNTYSEKSLINNRIENATAVTINFTGVDISLFKLNRKYNIQFQNRDKSMYNGLYRINNFGYGMSQKDFYVIGEFKKIVNI